MCDGRWSQLSDGWLRKAGILNLEGANKRGKFFG